MAGYSRASFPESFYDKTSDMLLVQPEPQYLYAQLCLAACRASLSVPGELGLPGRSVGGAGAEYSSAERDRLLLSSPMTTELFAAVVDFNKAPGNTVRVNRPVFANSTYTEASRRIDSGTTISTTPITPSSQQNDITLYRFGGPYDQANSRVAPYAIEAFDANMGIHKAASIIGTHMKRDFHRWVDAVNVALLDLASATDRPEGMSADDDATASGSFPMTYELICRVERQMDDANLPTLPDGFRPLVLHPEQVNQLRQDKAYQRASEDHPQYNILFPQYVSSVNKFHIFKSTTLTTATNNSGVTIYRGHAIAPGALMCGMGRPPRVAASTNDNFGETVLTVWLCDMGFKVANDTLVRLVSSSA
jgi:hypothetical protein